MVDARVARRALGLAALFVFTGCDSSIKNREHADKQIARLKAESSRAAAREKLAAADPQLVHDPLALLVADTAAAPEARVAAIEVLSNNVTAELILPMQVVDAFRSDAPEAVRIAALEAIVRSGAPEYVDAIASVAKAEGDALKDEASAALPRYEASRRAWYRREVRVGRTTAAQMIAMRSLGDFGTQEDVVSIKDAFASGAPQVKYEAILTLAKLGGPDATAFCLAQLEHEDPFIRAAAISAAQKFKDPRAIPSLQKALRDDGVADNRVSAALALATIGGKDARLALTTGCEKPATNPIRQACKSALKRMQ